MRNTVSKLVLASLAVMGPASMQPASSFEKLDVSNQFVEECLITTINFSSWLYENGVLCINGMIDSTTLYAFEEDMIPRNVDVIILNSEGGTKFGGEMVSKLIAEKAIDVIVPTGASCMSNCVMLLAAGNNQIVEDGARVGVHYVYMLAGAGWIEINKASSEWYFSEIGNKELYDAYKAWLLELNLASEYEVASDDNFFRKGSRDNWWPEQAMMLLTQDQLLDYGVIGN